ncbi:MAG: hypothetical protein ACRDYV_11445, partial [Acidimicrobiia bacterium]
MARPLLRQAVLAGLFVATSVAGVAHAALIDIEGVYVPVNALNQGTSTQNSDNSGAGGGGDQVGAVNVGPICAPANAANNGESTQEVSCAGTDEVAGSDDGAEGESSSSIAGIGGIGGGGFLPALLDVGPICAPVNAANSGKSTQEVSCPGGPDDGGADLLHIGRITLPLNLLNIGDSCQSVNSATPCDPDRPTAGDTAAPEPEPGPSTGPG